MTVDAYKVGVGLGLRLRAQVKTATEQSKRLRHRFPDWMLAGMNAAERDTPTAVALVKGMAAGAGVPYEDVFASWYEELLFAEQRNKSKLKDTGCTDVVVKDGADVLIGHTNDESPTGAPVFVRLCVSGLPNVFAVFSGGGPSVAANSAGLVFSGNQVDANDTRPGIPRTFLYMEACWSTSLEEAEAILLSARRASSFNNIVADAEGRVMTLEASATQAAKLLHEDGAVAHANHFLWLPHKEGRRGSSLENSQGRLDRALEEVGRDEVREVRDMIEVLSTHGEDGLCRHGPDVRTCFSVVFVPTRGVLLYGEGPPCEARYKAYKYVRRVDRD